MRDANAWTYGTPSTMNAVSSNGPVTPQNEPRTQAMLAIFWAAGVLSAAYTQTRQLHAIQLSTNGPRIGEVTLSTTAVFSESTMSDTVRMEPWFAVPDQRRYTSQDNEPRGSLAQ